MKYGRAFAIFATGLLASSMWAPPLKADAGLFPRSEFPTQVVVLALALPAASTHSPDEALRMLYATCLTQAGARGKHDPLWAFGRRGGSVRSELSPAGILLHIQSPAAGQGALDVAEKIMAGFSPTRIALPRAKHRVRGLLAGWPQEARKAALSKVASANANTLVALHRRVLANGHPHVFVEGRFDVKKARALVARAKNNDSGKSTPPRKSTAIPDGGGQSGLGHPLPVALRFERAALHALEKTLLDHLAPLGVGAVRIDGVGKEQLRIVPMANRRLDKVAVKDALLLLRARSRPPEAFLAGLKEARMDDARQFSQLGAQAMAQGHFHLGLQGADPVSGTDGELWTALRLWILPELFGAGSSAS
jgi:hypothetical protein